MTLIVNYSQVMSPPSYLFYIPKNQITESIFKKLSSGGKFIHNGTLFSHIGSVATGNPLGPMLADLFLGMIEKKIFKQNLISCPSLYVRNVDNVFAVFNSKADVHSLTVLDNQNFNLRFTCEEAPCSSPSVLDVEVTINDGKLNISVHCIPIFTGVLWHLTAQRLCS